LSLTPGRSAYRQGDTEVAVQELAEPELRRLQRTDWAFVHQHPRDGLRMAVSAGANIGERLMANNWRHYGDIRAEALKWLEAVEIDACPYR
jgi:putative phosphonate transport system ATP-binding protein